MSFEPEAVRAFEHAGWQRAASTYGNSFAHATAHYTVPLLEAAGVSSGQQVLTSHADQVGSLLRPRHMARPRKHWIFRPRWSPLPAAPIPRSL